VTDTLSIDKILEAKRLLEKQSGPPSPPAKIAVGLWVERSLREQCSPLNSDIGGKVTMFYGIKIVLDVTLKPDEFTVYDKDENIIHSGTMA